MNSEKQLISKTNEHKLPGHAVLFRETPVNDVPPVVQEALDTPSRPLDAGTREFFEPRFGYDFSQVRIYTDSKAAEAAQAVDANAFTLGSNIVFGAEQCAPATGAGKQLIAHELAHVVLHQHSPTLLCQRKTASPDQPKEQEANQLTSVIDLLSEPAPREAFGTGVESR